MSNKPFILYTRALGHSLGVMLAQNNDDGKEVALYYLSRMLVGAEHKYKLVEKKMLSSHVRKAKASTLFTLKYSILSVPNKSTQGIDDES